LTIGDDYAQALAEGLKAFDAPQSIVLKGNNLSDKGALPIINSLKKDIKTLDISINPRITLPTFITLFDIVDSKLFQ
jgi:hypothetical protein